MERFQPAPPGILVETDAATTDRLFLHVLADFSAHKLGLQFLVAALHVQSPQTSPEWWFFVLPGFRPQPCRELFHATAFLAFFRQNRWVLRSRSLLGRRLVRPISTTRCQY